MIKRRLANFLFRIFFFFTCKLDPSDLEKLPKDGPGIIITNHTTIIEGPMYYVFLYPRKMTALGKAELWKNPITRFFMNAWEIIPLKRGANDRDAIRKGLEVLDAGYFLGVAPEGTRSKTGQLIRGHRGASYFATVKKVPIYPLAQWGLMHWPGYLLKFSRCPVSIRVGRPFYLGKTDDSVISSEDRKKMTDEMMYQIAELLPQELRGYYSDPGAKTEKYISFLDE